VASPSSISINEVVGRSRTAGTTMRNRETGQYIRERHCKREMPRLKALQVLGRLAAHCMVWGVGADNHEAYTSCSALNIRASQPHAANIKCPLAPLFFPSTLTYFLSLPKTTMIRLMAVRLCSVFQKPGMSRVVSVYSEARYLPQKGRIFIAMESVLLLSS
jgi:hypothetical protein